MMHGQKNIKKFSMINLQTPPQDINPYVCCDAISNFICFSVYGTARWH